MGVFSFIGSYGNVVGFSNCEGSLDKVLEEIQLFFQLVIVVQFGESIWIVLGLEVEGIFLWVFVIYGDEGKDDEVDNEQYFVKGSLKFVFFILFDGENVDQSI